jgi:hypothetical protein
LPRALYHLKINYLNYSLRMFRRFVTLFLALLMLTASLGGALHALVGHHDENLSHCGADGRAMHFHTPEYGLEACPFWDFVFAVAIVPAAAFWHLPACSALPKMLANHYRAPAGLSRPILPTLRGPPALARHF